jgi:cytochrome c-type biogenesis protein CcmH/NrfF
VITPLHLGAMHPIEQVLTLVLAFGPVLVLGVVIVVRRRADDREAEEARVEEARGEEAQAEERAQRER